MVDVAAASVRLEQVKTLLLELHEVSIKLQDIGLGLTQAVTESRLAQVAEK